MDRDDKPLVLIREAVGTYDGVDGSVELLADATEPADGGGFAARVRIRPGDTFQVMLRPVPGALGIAAVARIAADRPAAGPPVVVLASIVGEKVGAALVERGLCYMDLAGNCHLELGDGRATVHVAGRRRARGVAGAGGLRAAGYRVLFCLLADPVLLERTVRDIGLAANASRHAVHSLMARLRDEGVLVRAGRSRHVFASHGREKCIDRFTAAWSDVLRGNLLAGRFRMREQDPALQEQRIANELHAAGVPFGFGGASGSSRWLRHLRSDEVVVHVDGWGPEVARRLGALPDREGPLWVFRTMTTLDLQSGEADAAHPLLIHAELARSPDPRARETALLLLERIAGAADR